MKRFSDLYDGENGQVKCLLFNRLTSAIEGKENNIAKGITYLVEIRIYKKF